MNRLLVGSMFSYLLMNFFAFGAADSARDSVSTLQHLCRTAIINEPQFLEQGLATVMQSRDSVARHEFMRFMLSRVDKGLQNRVGKKGKQVLYGHKDFVWFLMFSPDESMLASTANDGTLRLWDVAKWKCIDILHGNGRGLMFLRFSSDGKTIFARDRVMRNFAWDVASGQPLPAAEQYFKNYVGDVASNQPLSEAEQYLGGSSLVWTKDKRLSAEVCSSKEIYIKSDYIDDLLKISDLDELRLLLRATDHWLKDRYGSAYFMKEEERPAYDRLVSHFSYFRNSKLFW